MDDDPKLDAALYKIAEDHAEVPDACAWPPFLSKEGVPTNRTKRDSFRVLMRSELAEARNLHLSAPQIISAFPTLPAVDGHLKEIDLAADNLTNRLLKPADEAHTHALEQLPLLLASERDDNSLGPIAQIQRDLSELHPDNPVVAITKILGELAKVISITHHSLQKTKDDPAISVGYQTTNIKKHLGARHVIRSLIIVSDKMGKRLTFSRGPDDVEGPLIEAINMLKEADEFFSHGFFPEKLRKICEDVRRELNCN